MSGKSRKSYEKYFRIRDVGFVHGELFEENFTVYNFNWGYFRLCMMVTQAA